MPHGDLDGEKKTLQGLPPKKETEFTYQAEPDKTENNEVRFTMTFQENTELTGYMKLRLWVATNDTDDMDLFVGVKKYDRRGNEVYLPDFNHIENG